MKIGKKYVWKSLSADGLLKEPQEIGPYYDTFSLNRNENYEYGFKSEEDAFNRVILAKKLYPYCFNDHYTLVTLYEVEED